MTAHYIAKVVQSQYDKVSVDELLNELSGVIKYESGRLSDEWTNKQLDNKQYHRWIDASSLLNEYIRYHFAEFEQTDLVYYWAKDLCERKNDLFNKYRSRWTGMSFKEWLISQGTISRSGRFIG